jgi:hypothetical protein
MNAPREIEDLGELVDHFVSDENRTFAEPWQALAFALAFALSQKDLLPSNRLSLPERDVVGDAESRKVHQRVTSRDENGQLRVAPLLVDPALI